MKLITYLHVIPSLSENGTKYLYLVCMPSSRGEGQLHILRSSKIYVIARDIFGL